MLLTTYSVKTRAALFHFPSMSFQHFTWAEPRDSLRAAISSDKSQHTNLCFDGSSQRQVRNAHCERVKVGSRGLARRLLRDLGLEKTLQATKNIPKATKALMNGTVSSTWSGCGSYGSCVSENNIQNTHWQKIGDDLSRLYIEVYYSRVI